MSLSIPEREELIKLLKKFCEQELAPHLTQDEENELFRLEFYQKLGELGICGITTSEEFGGLGLPLTILCDAIFELGKLGASYAVTLSVSTMVQNMIENFGNDFQKKIYLPKLSSGEEIGAFALTEGESGSDAASLKTSAKKVEGGYLLNGTKMFITSGGIAKTYIVMARTGGPGSSGISAFIVRDGIEGFQFGKKEKKMGWKISPTRELIFNNCFVSDRDLLGQEGDGFKFALSGLDRGRITIASLANGLSQKALDLAVNYSVLRTQFKQPIFEFQGIQFILAEASVELEASKLLVEKAALEFSQGKKNIKLASMAKLKATDTAMKITTDAVQIFGGVGYTCEFPVERLMRDAKVLQIVEGTNQIQKIVIARELKKELK